MSHRRRGACVNLLSPHCNCEISILFRARRGTSGGGEALLVCTCGCNLKAIGTDMTGCLKCRKDNAKLVRRECANKNRCCREHRWARIFEPIGDTYQASHLMGIAMDNKEHLFKSPADGEIGLFDRMMGLPAELRSLSVPQMRARIRREPLAALSIDLRESDGETKFSMNSNLFLAELRQLRVVTEGSQEIKWNLTGRVSLIIATLPLYPSTPLPLCCSAPLPL